MAVRPASSSRRRRQTAPARTVGGRAKEIIDPLREKLRKNVGSAIDGRDPEGVHDMRVASRRLRAALQIFGPWLDPHEAERAAWGLRRVTRALGRVRELDVLRTRLASFGARAQPERKLVLEILDSRLARRRQRERARMMKSFASVDLDKLDGQLRRLSGTPPELPTMAQADADGLTIESLPLPTSAEDSIDVLLQQIAPDVVSTAEALAASQIAGEIGSPEASGALHQVRIQAKKLRYQLEIIAQDLGADGAKLVSSLRGLQDRLGDFHDDAVLDETLREEITRQAARGRPLHARELRRLRTVRRSALRRDERSCRKAIENLREHGFGRAVADGLRALGALPGEVDVPIAAESVGEIAPVSTTDGHDRELAIEPEVEPQVELDERSTGST